jgi:glutaminyl-peptide cyclotransferase
MSSLHFILATLSAAAAALSQQQQAVAPVPAPTVHRFDAAGAYALAREQVALGPRPAGSPVERRAAQLLVKRLPDGRFEAIPGGLRNVVGELPGRPGPAILLIAHYDTTDVPGYLGANNSAAAVGAVVELAKALEADQRPTDRAIRFLLTDGEEAPPGFTNFLTSGLRGSRAYAATHQGQIADVIVLDFVGNRGLRLPRESGSNPALWGQLRTAAARVGESQVFPDLTRSQIYDDHTPFAAQGVPAIDLIDFDYPCWQRPCDTMAQVSQRSIDASGEAVLELVRELRR